MNAKVRLQTASKISLEELLLFAVMCISPRGTKLLTSNGVSAEKLEIE